MKNIYMNELLIFTDASVNTQTKIGCGAFLVISGPNVPLEKLESRIKLQKFEDTSSTKLELQTLLWALGEIQTRDQKVIVYTDSQNIFGLPGRREGFEKNNYFTVKKKRIKNFELYKEFYRLTEQIDYELVQVAGHKKSHHKDYIDELFTLVDRAARKALRKINNEKANE